MKYLLAIDVGTTNVKVAAYTAELKEVVKTKEALKINIYGEAAEQNLEEIYRTTVEAIRSVARKPEIRGKIGSIFISSQMHGLALLDSNGKPLTPLYTYLDRRAAAQAEELEEKLERKIYEETGCPPLYIYPLAKLLWIKNRGMLPANRKISVSVKDYLLWKLTGEHLIDPSTASGSGLLDIRKLRWSGLALGAAEVDEESLPTVIGEDCALRLKRDEAERMGLDPNVTLYPGVSDAAAHQAGVLALTGKALALNIGTSAAIRIASPRPTLDSGGMRFFCYYGFTGRWLVGGAVNNAGVALEWLIRKVFNSEGGAETYRILDEEMLGKEPSDIVFVPFLSGERFPVRDSKAKAVIAGLTLANERADIARALLEGVTFTLKWIYEAMSENGIDVGKIRLGGGAARLKTWRKIVADVFKLPTIYVKGGAELLGDALILSSIESSVSIEKIVEKVAEVVEEPEVPGKYAEIYSKKYEKFKTLYFTTRDVLRK